MAQAFGGWLLNQKGRPDWVGSLAKAALKDPAFPKTGSVNDVRMRLSNLAAEADMFEALDDAESEFLCTVQ